VTVKADATPQQGSINKVDFYRDGTTLLGTDTTAPYSYVFTPGDAGGVAIPITIVATDSNGATLTSSAVNITMVAADGTPPTVTIASPGDNSIIAVPSDAIPITVTANDSDGRIERVEVYVAGAEPALGGELPAEVAVMPLPEERMQRGEYQRRAEDAEPAGGGTASFHHDVAAEDDFLDHRRDQGVDAEQDGHR